MIERWSVRVVAAGVALLVVIAGSHPAWAQDCTAGATFSGPILITSGGTYSGNWQSQSPSVPAVQIFTRQPVSIINSRIKGPGDLILIGSRGNVTVQQSCFVGTNPNIAGQAKRNAIHAYQSASLVVEHNDFEATGYYGVWFQEYLGDGTPSNSIKIRYNRFHNVDARQSNGSGGYLTTVSSQISHAIILSGVLGVPGIEIAWNQIVHEPYQSGVGDSINIHDSSGTSASPMQVHDNYIQGGWDSDPTNGDGFPYYGSAITTDGYFQTDPGLTTAFLKIHDNQAVGFGNVGIVIALGHDVEMYNNRAISSGQLANGTSSATSYRNGIQHINWRSNPPSAFFNTSVHDNVSGVRRRRNGSWERKDYNFGVPPTVSGNNVSFAPTTASAPTTADEVNESVLWTRKLAAQGLTVGMQPAGVPGAPGSLTASANGSTVTLAWTFPASGVAPTTYYLEAGSTTGAADLANFSTGGIATAFTASGVGNGTYYVRVRAANAIGAGPASPDATLVVGSSCSAPPPTPAGLANAVAGSTVTLTWSPSPGATSFVLEAGSTTGASNLAVLDTGNANPAYVAPGVGAGVYFVRIRAKNACATSGPSNETIVRVQ